MSNLPPYDRLDPRVQKTIDCLYEAFIRLLEDKHYRYIKVLDITKAARINRATFYNHFENMADFIIFCSREGFRRDVLVEFRSKDFLPNRENFTRLVSCILTFMSVEFSKWHYRWDEILFEKAVRVELYHFLSNWFPNHKQAMSAFGNSTALLISSAVTGLGMVWCGQGCVESVDDLADRIVNVFAEGLRELE